MKNKIFERTNELALIKKALEEKGSGFFYVRGRRRVGKSWLLKKLAEKDKNVFYFMGALDAKTQVTLSEFAQSWIVFSGDKTLSELKKTAYNWKRFFDEITKKAHSSKQTFVLVFDEIQWIAKEGSGFIGKLKEAWADWEQTGKIKVIICGSSNKFFSNHVGGEEKILRGLKTHSDILIKPFTFVECVTEKFKNWHLEEAAIAYMMTGGVPYYLNQIDEKKSFVHAINDAFFTQSGIFLEEVDEILRLDFNKKGLRSVKKILSAISLQGVSEKTIVKKTQISDSTVNDVLGKMVDYGLVDILTPHNKISKGNLAGSKYIINDFYLNTYFTLLQKIENKIKANQKALIFTNYCLKSQHGYYIEGYTGYMFERLIRAVLNSRSLKEKIFSILDLRDEDYIVSQFWDKDHQLDLIVDHGRDRVSRAIEIKWITEKNIDLTKIEHELSEKNYPVTTYFQRKNYIIVPDSRKKTGPSGTCVLSLRDLLKKK